VKQVYFYSKSGKPEIVVLGHRVIARGVWTTVTEDEVQEIDQDELDSREVLVRDVEEKPL
jgi:hypothetical protein